MWSVHRYLLLHSIIDITFKNRKYCQKMDAINPCIFNKISTTVAFSTYLLIALIGSFIVEYYKAIYRCHSQDDYFQFPAS